MFQAGASLSKMANAIKQVAIEKAKEAHMEREQVIKTWVDRKFAECEARKATLPEGEARAAENREFKIQEHRAFRDLLECAHLTSTVEDVFVGKIADYLNMNYEITQEIFDKTVDELLKPGAFWKNVHAYME
jgi:hypothetical protein